MKSKYYLLQICIHFACLLSSELQSQVLSNAFLEFGTGARAQGLGGTSTATGKDVNCVYWNPALLSRLEVPLQIGGMHAETFGGVVKFDHVGVIKRIRNDKGVAGLSIIRAGVDDIPNTLHLYTPAGEINYDNISTFSAADYAFILSYAQEWKHGIRIGGNAKVIHRTIGPFGKAWGFGIDLGAAWNKGPWSLGIHGRDITGTYNAWSFQLSEQDKLIFQQTGNTIPVNSVEVTKPHLILGGAYLWQVHPQASIQPMADLVITTDGERNVLLHSGFINVDPRVGIETLYKKFLAIRLGAGGWQQRTDLVSGKKGWVFTPSFGVGLTLGRLHLDYALSNIGNVAEIEYSHIFSLVWDFKAKNASASAMQ